MSKECSSGQGVESEDRRGGVCKSALSEQFRARHADYFKLSAGWLINSRLGIYDGNIFRELRRCGLIDLVASWGTEADAAVLAREASASGQVSWCSDCRSMSGVWKYVDPQNPRKGVVRCRHFSRTGAA
jgi:hypothetical protein